MATKKKTTGKALAKTKPGGALVLAHDYGDMAGEGQENMTSADQSIPFISILQAQSPQVAKEGKKIEGAKAGMFLDSVTQELHSELIFVPCSTDHLYVEWRPRSSGGGFVGRHGLHSGIMSKTKKGGEKDRKNVLANGNEIVETFYVLGMLLENADDAEPIGACLLAFTSSGITKYKKSIGELRKYPGAPLFAHRLRLTTYQDSNADGDWYNWTIMPVNQVEGDPVFRNGINDSLISPSTDQAALLTMGKALKDDYLAGAANIAYDSQGSEGEGGATDTHF